MSIRFLSLLLLVSGAAAAADREFDSVVKAIEGHYGTRRTHIPLMGAANFFVRVARPSGTGSFHLAVFENLNGVEDDRDEFMERLVMDRLVMGSLHPLVRIRSSHAGEATYILAGEGGKSTRMLIAAFGRREATVIEVKVNASAMRRTLDRPASVAKSFMGRHEDR